MRLKLWAANNSQRLLDLVPGSILGQSFMPTSFLRKNISVLHTLKSCHGKPIHTEPFPIVFKVSGKGPVV